MCALPLQSIPSAPGYSSVIVEEEPPPPYPGNEGSPPPYYSVAPRKPHFVFLNDCSHVNISSNRESQCEEENSGNVPRRRRGKKPLAPRFIAWFDIIFNCCCLLIFAFDVMERKQRSLSTLWLANFNLVWIVAAYKLYQSADLEKSRQERKKLTGAWKNFNYFILFLVGFLTATCIVATVVAGAAVSSRADSALLAFVLFVIIAIPGIVRIIFAVIIHDYIQCI